MYLEVTENISGEPAWPKEQGFNMAYWWWVGIWTDVKIIGNFLFEGVKETSRVYALLNIWCLLTQGTRFYLVLGCGSQDIWELSVRGGSGPPSGPMTYTPFDATCHNEHGNMWLRVANLKRFQDIWVLSVLRPRTTFGDYYTVIRWTIWCPLVTSNKN